MTHDSLEQDRGPIACLGVSDGWCFVLSAAGELRRLRDSDLEGGRGVRGLFAGSRGALAYASGQWPAKGGGLDTKAAGAWIVDRCAEEGLFDPVATELRSLGVWRGESGEAIAHVGNALVGADCVERPLSGTGCGAVYIAAPKSPRPASAPAGSPEIRQFEAKLAHAWGWRSKHEPRALLGWTVLALLGGFPEWRPGLVVSGLRGAGKTALADLIERLLGPMAGGGVFNGASEAGLRQSADHTARAMLFDEFEADAGRAGAQADILALMRRACGGGGGRVLRGGATGVATEFRMRAAVALFAINPPALSAADRSRIVRIDLGPLPVCDPDVAARLLVDLGRRARDLGPRLWCRALARAGDWDRAVAVLRTFARSHGADARQADTAAAIAAGYALAVSDGEGIETGKELFRDLVGALLDAGRDECGASDGERCLAQILEAHVPASPGMAPCSISDLMRLAVLERRQESAPLGEWDRRLANYGLRVAPDGSSLYVASRHSQLAQIFRETPWQAGGHDAALLGVEGAERDQFRAGARRYRGVRVPLRDHWVPS